MSIFGQNKTNESDAKIKRKYKHYKHSPFTMEYNGVKVECDENGKIKLTKEMEDGTYDEINTSANLIYKIGDMLRTTKKVVYKDTPYKEEE